VEHASVRQADEEEVFIVVPSDSGRLAITPELLLPELLCAHPEARAVFDRCGLRGCGGPLGPHETIRFFARVHGINEPWLLHELERSIAAPNAPSGDAASGQDAPQLADTIYRRYFISAIILVLTAGASWGAWLLWDIALNGSFQSVSLSSVNAHGEVQIFGWVGLFIMGFAYQAFPRLWQTALAIPRLAAWVFALALAGLLVRTTGITAAEAWSKSPVVALAGGTLELAAIVIFAGQILATWMRSDVKIEPYIGFVVAALVWFVVSSIASIWHTWNTMTAQSEGALIWYVATYQSPLRDLQIHGVALFMILGVSQRMLPALYEVPRVSNERGWTALGLLVAAVLGEVVLFWLARWTGNRNFAACLLLPRAMLATGCALIVLPWRPWRSFPGHDRSAKFVRAAYGWLAIALVMLCLQPAYQYACHQLGVARALPFSHAYHGAIRHATTVGFVSLMIMGIAAKVVPMLNGVDPERLSQLLGPFLLVNVGCLLRVVMQVLTDWSVALYPLLGISGTLEVTGLAWWGFGLVGLIRRGSRAASAPAASHEPRPGHIEGGHRVGEILEWFPETEPVFLDRGFTAIRQPLLRRTVARQVTLSQAAGLRGVPLDELLTALNGAITRGCHAQDAPPPDLVMITRGVKPR
jgi:hypothetical protein